MCRTAGTQVAIRMRLREALSAFSELSDPRREIKALQVTGFSYTEIGEMRGLTYTRVNRMIAEANAVLREKQGREAVVKVHGSPRALINGGGAPGMNGDLRIYPKSGYVVAVLPNLDPPAAQRISQYLDPRLPTE